MLFFSGSDDRGTDSFKVVNQRDLTWHVEPSGIIEIDQYGRIDALKQGIATLKVVSASNNQVFDSKTINVTSKTESNLFSQLPKRVINYTGTAA